MSVWKVAELAMTAARALACNWAVWLICGLACCSIASAQQTPSDAERLLSDEQAAFRAAAEKAAPSVVQIETFGGLERVGKELISDGPTTGTVVAEGGWVVSSLYSFRQQPASILVSLPNGKRVAARIVARDYSRELALLKLEEDVQLPVPIATPKKEVQVGEWTIALGRTFDNASVSQSVGIVSALDRAYGKAIQTDAKVSPVNYGGPLVDLQGRVIGVLAPISPGAILEGDSSQLYDSGIGFAVPLEDILARLPQWKTGKDIRSGKLGIVMTNQNELAGPVKLAGAAPGSPASKSGLKAGDIIVEAGGRPVTLLAHLRHAMGPLDAGEEFKFTIDRKGKRLEISSQLVEEIPTYRLRYLGLEVEQGEGEGVVVTKVWSDSPAAAARIKIGSRITASGEVPIAKPQDLRQQVAVAELDVAMTLNIVAPGDGEKAKSVSVKPVVWPNKIEPREADGKSDPAKATEVKVRELELALGDFPNKAVAWAPVFPDANAEAKKNAATDAAATDDTPKVADNGDKPAAKKARIGELGTGELGLLVLIPEPGEVDRKKVRELWEPIVRQGWVVACVASSDPKRWSPEEIELVERVISRVEESYSIDSAKTVVGGLGVGARLAVIGARAVKGKASGVLMLAAPLEGVRVQRENTPLESLHFLLSGPEESYQAFLQQLQKLGYPSIGLAAPEMTSTKWDTLPLDQIKDWLFGLGRI